MGTRTKTAVASYVVVCFALDFFPRFGPPEFRYTGSEPTFPVWNLGWPLALAIYDVRSSLHVSPSVYLVPPAQLLVLLATVAFISIVKRAGGTERGS